MTCRCRALPRRADYRRDHRVDRSAELTTYLASIVVRYARNTKMGLWVPTEMKERYSAVVQAGVMRQTGERLLEGTARYSNFRRFQVSTEERVIVPK